MSPAADPVQPDLRALAAERVMDTMGWEDDRDDPGGGGVPPAACWTLAGDVADAVLAVVLPAHRRQVLTEAVDAIERQPFDYKVNDGTTATGGYYRPQTVTDAVRRLAATAPATGPAPSLTAQDGPPVAQEGAEAPRPSERARVDCLLPVGEGWCPLRIGHDGDCGPAGADLQPELAPTVVAPTEPAELLAPRWTVTAWRDRDDITWTWEDGRWYIDADYVDAETCGPHYDLDDLRKCHGPHLTPLNVDDVAALLADHARLSDSAAPGWPSVAALQQAYDEMVALYQASVAQRAAEPRDPAADAAESATWETMRQLLAKVEGERDEARAELGALQRHFALANDSAIDYGDWLQDAREELTALNDQLWHALDIDPETSPSPADMVDMLVGQTRDLGEAGERLRVERDRLAALVERVGALAQRWIDTGTTAGAGVLASAVFHALDDTDPKEPTP